MHRFSFPLRPSYTTLFVGLALFVALLSFFWSNRLIRELAKEERRMMEVWALATESIIAGDEDADISLELTILQSNHSIPVILCDGTTGAMVSHNLRLPEKDTLAFLREKCASFKNQHPPIRMEETGQLLYYDDSYTLKRLHLFPYLQFLLIAFFIALAFFALNRSQRAEQNGVWVGLSKETAHQLATPISSLMAWSEYLKLKNGAEGVPAEFDKDIDRLRMIADRFSKIGTPSELKPTDLRETVRQTLAYMEKRISGNIALKMVFPEHPVTVPLNEPLFGWVIENLVKNGADAMGGTGLITFTAREKNGRAVLDVGDTGKGIPASKFKTVFTPGYTTKERGWGLGLSLVKRIVEETHHGKIFVKQSAPGKGTVFRIVLQKD